MLPFLEGTLNHIILSLKFFNSVLLLGMVNMSPKYFHVYKVFCNLVLAKLSILKYSLLGIV